MITKEKYIRQLKLEEEGITLGIEKFRREMIEAKQRGGFNDTKVGTIITYQLMAPFVQNLTEAWEVKLTSRYAETPKSVMKTIGYDKVALIALKTLLGGLTDSELSLTSVAERISDNILLEYNLQNFKAQKRKDDDNNTYKSYVDSTIRQKAKTGSSKQRTAMILKVVMNKEGFIPLTLDKDESIWFGTKILDCFVSATGLIKLNSKYLGKSSTKVLIEPTQELLKHIEKLEGECEVLSPMLYPMIVPPKDHDKGVIGGFLTECPSLQYSLVKTNNKYLKDWEMPKVYSSINSIQKTAWKINDKVLGVLQELYNRGKEIPELDLPALKEIEIPVKPWGELNDAEWEMYKANNPEIVSEWKEVTRDAHNKNATQKSKRILYSSLISVANKFRNEEELYYCYSLDWRGRVYPVQSTMCPNPQGIDASKALLRFSKTVPLGEHGAYWLSVQGANTFGDDKLPMDERGLWASLHEDKIMAVAKDPLENKWWWEADEPWKFLSFCFDWAGYVESGYSKSYESYTAVALDGSCSGIQHFSALLKDRRGALATNVINGEVDKPSDIYGEVAKVVNERIKNDARLGVPEAIILQGKITRKETKRNTMTTPYGVTQRGMIDQLMSELPRDKFSSPVVSFYNACKYLAKANFEAIGEVVVASRQAMDWLKEVTKVMAQADKVFTWTVPSGFKVRQAYYKPSSKKIDTYWGSTRYRLSVEKPTLELNHKKVKAGQAPNYIHSMDGSHLILTVDYCVEQDVTDFALIHDSFGTHAGNTHILAKGLRVTFVEMYSQDNLEIFRDEIIEQLPEELKCKVPPVPAKGTLSLNNVLTSTYFFS